MAPTVSLSARVSPEVRARLAAEARAQGMALASYAAKLLSGPVMDAPQPGSGAIQLEVECFFEHLPDGLGLEREVCMGLARIAEAGGSPGIAAGRELLNETQRLTIRYAGYEDEDEDEDGS